MQASVFVRRTLLSRIKEREVVEKVAQQCNTRVVSGGGSAGSAQARAYIAFIFDTFRVARLTGEFPKDEPVSVPKILGQDHKSAGWVHIVFKKQEFIEFIMHESALLMDSKMVEALQAFATPASILKHFSATGEGGLVDRFLKSESAASELICSLNECFADKVAQYRSSVCTSKVQMLMDMMWGTWSGAFEKQFQHLAFRECSAAAAGSAPFQWHRHLSNSSDELSMRYRAFLAVYNVGPEIAAVAAPWRGGST